ncbi:MAG: non-homologous end-joining DNA ligase [Planctomycetaceae bacterium]|nr:non-homologous end-joining DNA ligase [Planctomycetaceae bacterium]
MAKTRVVIQDRPLDLSNLDKVLYPAAGTTKAHVLDYYRRVAPWLLPHVRARPLTLKRYPDGVHGEAFYEKRCPSHRPEWMTTAPVQHRGGTSIRYCSVTDLPGLIWVANLAALELHVLLSRGMSPQTPTAVAFDLDPGPPAGLIEAAEVCLLLRRVLDGVGLTALAKVSGKNGMHCYVPLNTPVTFDQTKQFALTVAQLMEKHYPQRVTSKMRKEHRGGKIFIDWSQNDEHKTTVCVYSLRATPEPRVSTPVAWEELEAAVKAGKSDRLQFSPQRVIERLEKEGDLFAEALTLRQVLPGIKTDEFESPPQWQSNRDAKGKKRHSESLADYEQKRHFERTPEPTPSQPQKAAMHNSVVHVPEPAASEPIFVVQKHAARNEHYDFRLQAGDVLTSWAVPKGPSMNPADKRLAMHVEDHPLSYARFEGEIPPGQYGAGYVIVWDYGSFEPLASAKHPEADLAEAIRKGHVEVRLHGVKLHGVFLLVRSSAKAGGRDQWLLMKKDDAAAQTHVDVARTEPYSVLSGLWIEDLAAASPNRRRRRRKTLKAG